MLLTMPSLTRRKLLKIGSAAAAAELASLGLYGCGASKLVPSVPSGCSKLTNIEHVVILTQENRSFDHYFGSYRGVRGFSDRSAAFQQPDPTNTTSPSVGALLPFHLDTAMTNAACTHDITHDWVLQHQSWNNGAMDGFVSSRLPINSNDAILSMGYYEPSVVAGAIQFTAADGAYPWTLSQGEIQPDHCSCVKFLRISNCGAAAASSRSTRLISRPTARR
jgi:phospholipase C